MLTVVLAILLAAASFQVSVPGQPVLTVTAGDLARMPRAKASATHHGVTTDYEGVWLHEILKRAGALQGEKLRGKALATYVLMRAEDGYVALYSLAELDPSFIDNQVLLADTADGKPLAGSRGHFQIVASREKPGARSIRMLTRIDVVQVPLP